jgi:short-chain fatty acids transporter
MTSATLNERSKGSFLWRFSKKFQFAADKIIPDSLVFCLILTFIVFAAAMVMTGTGPIQLCMYWYDGLWTQISFAFQMAFMVIVCATCAKSPQVNKLLGKLATAVKTPQGAMILLMLFGFASSFVNWAFCTIVTPILAMQLSKHIKGLHFPMMIAAGYSTMILGQCLGPTASVYALLATEGHFLQDTLGIITQDQSVYNPMNVMLFCVLAGVTIILAVMTRPPKEETVEFTTTMDEKVNDYSIAERVTIAEKLNGSRICMWLIGIAGIIVMAYSFATMGFFGALSVNFIIFMFLTINCFLYNTPTSFVGAHKDSMKLATEVMIQFPFYGGIMGIMATSGMATIIVEGIVSIATPESLPVWAYISASVVNLFIPSQGGQFIIQGPLLVDAAHQIGANVTYVINAFVYGDEATNLLQPLYVIPALSVVGMKLKDVWGFMAFIWAFWTVITCLGLYFIPMFV